MTTVTGLTAERMIAIEAASVVDGDVVGDNLVLTKHDGSTINAGNVRGPSGTAGAEGPQGPSGSTGAQGPKGDPGTAGAQGPPGTTGAQGPKGDTGSTGAQGIQGPPGTAGSTGAQGPKGDPGTAGSTGAQGPPGNTGAQGIQGTPGEKWFTQAGAPAGATGIVGDWALDSANGDYYEKTAAAVWTLRGNLKGATGAQGIQGTPGTAGSTGAQGPKGDPGATGSTGAQGPQGVKGDTGSQGIQGPVGPAGTDLSVLAAIPVLDVGVLNQIRAGRQLTAADFTNMGLSAPLGLWNLSDLTDASGNARTLSNKGAVTFDIGINGAAATAAKFSGNVAQALYIADTGAADPFRIKTGSWGCWVRTAKRSGSQYLMSKSASAAGQYAWFLSINNVTAQAQVSGDGNATGAINGVSDIADDRWHFIVLTYDAASFKIYVDGMLEAVVSGSGAIFSSSGPVNIGGYGADGATNVQGPHFGRIDEAFVTGDVLSDEQIRLLYCAKITHGLAAVPKRASVNVHRLRKGAPPTSPDFGTAPQRLYNFQGGSLNDSGTNGTALLNNGNAPAVSGADGSLNNAFLFTNVQFLISTDAGLPAALTPRSVGCWFKTTTVNPAVNQTLVQYGTYNTADLRLLIDNAGLLRHLGANDAIGDRFVADGQWHHAVIVEDNAALDGNKRKLYLDGRMVFSTTTMFAITLAGANSFRIGQNNVASAALTGVVDSVFVCDFALPLETIAKLYAKGAQDLGVSPKNVGDHIERMDATTILATFDILDSQHAVDLVVA